MGVIDWLRGAPVDGSEAGPENVALSDVLNKYDLLEVADDYLVVAERPVELSATSRRAAMSAEVGGYGASNYYGMARGDYNPALAGNKGLQKYDEMRRSNGQVRKSLRTIKTPVIGARWYMEAATESKKDRKIAEFTWNCLTKYQSVSWPQLLMEILSFIDFGHYNLEVVYEFKVIDGEKRVVWKKLAPRHPLDSVSGWEYDSKGGPNGCWFTGSGKSGQEVFIPISKLLTFTFDKEAGNMEGIAVLRSAYMHWYFIQNLYKIDAIQKERHGIGIPIIKLPINYNDADKAAAENLGANLRTNEKAHVVLPPMWEILFAKLEGQPVDCMLSIEHHNKMILANIMAEFLGGGETGDSDAQLDMFVKGTRFIADIVRDVFNKWAIPTLVDYNFPNVKEYPELKVRRIGDTTDWRVLSFAMRNLVGAGILQVDDRLEEWTRDEMDLPRLDVDSIRSVATPQGTPTSGPSGKSASPKVGPPRQAVAGKMKVSPGDGKVGKDGSGTSGGGRK